MANRFVLNETGYHGKGAIAEIATEVKSRGFKKCFVCSDPDLLKFGVTAKVTDILDGAKIDYEIYSNIKANPTVANVKAGVEAFKKSGADCIVAIGGGSSMDTAKAVGIIIANPEHADVRSLEGAVVTATNHNAGINGGIANGMPVVFRTVVKPTPSIYKQQDTVDYLAKKDAQLSIQGRHDPCIVPRAAIVQTCAAALAVGDLLTARYGAAWMTHPTSFRKEDE